MMILSTRRFLQPRWEVAGLIGLCKKRRRSVTSSVFLRVIVICFVQPKHLCCHGDVSALEETLDSGHPMLGQPLKSTKTVTVVLFLGLCRAEKKSAQVQQILNQKQHPSLCQAAVQSARSKPPCRCGIKLPRQIKAHQSTQDMSVIVRDKQMSGLDNTAITPNRLDHSRSRDKNG